MRNHFVLQITYSRQRIKTYINIQFSITYIEITDIAVVNPNQNFLFFKIGIIFSLHIKKIIAAIIQSILPFYISELHKYYSSTRS